MDISSCCPWRLPLTNFKMWVANLASGWKDKSKRKREVKDRKRDRAERVFKKRDKGREELCELRNSSLCYEPANYKSLLKWKGILFFTLHQVLRHTPSSSSILGSSHLDVCPHIWIHTYTYLCCITHTDKHTSTPTTLLLILRPSEHPQNSSLFKTMVNTIWRTSWFTS